MKRISCGMYESEHGCPGYCKKPKKVVDVYLKNINQ